MTRFMHKLAEGLRTREQYLEEHSDHPIFETDEGSVHKREYDDLVSELKDFSARVEKLTATGKNYDEHFEHEINHELESLSVKIDAWKKDIT